jgi:hypothetical protein
MQLKELGELMINLDPTMIFYKYKQTYKDEKDACNKLSQLPTMITGIQSYMNGFRPSPEGGDLWGNIRIGIDSNPTEFLENASQEANMRKIWLRMARSKSRKQTTQAGFTSALKPCTRRSFRRVSIPLFTRCASKRNVPLS